ncbi:hypothetical protein [Mesorhizobium ciceri]|uniref:hypothetical protein n=1 Tax=unclassified Mesorhizobium TaxID=325217 RepID=UPI0030B8DA7E
MLLYLITGLFWLPVVWMQIEMRDLSPCRPRQRSKLHHSAATPWHVPPFQKAATTT